MRIISGKYGGRPLYSLDGENTRPTADKLKETIFNIIGPYFKGGKVLDLYAGSGALGIEAVSRGMDSAVLVEMKREATEVISKNIQITKEPAKFELVHAKAHHALEQLASRKEKFTLIFLDPPYGQQTVAADIEKMIEKDLLADIALIVCEVAWDVELPEDIQGIPIWDKREYRNKKIVIYQKMNQ